MSNYLITEGTGKVIKNAHLSFYTQTGVFYIENLHTEIINSPQTLLKEYG